jgi:glucose-6-phosphate 1-dehydrogenase
MKRLVILGAAGDLTFRYLLPGLAQLEAANELAEQLEVVGVARKDTDDSGYREQAAEQLAEHAGGVDEEHRDALVDRLRYVQGDVTDLEVLRKALGDDDEPMVAYLALPPSVFADAIDALHEVGLPDGSRLVVEKPFGEDIEHAIALNEKLHACLPEDAIFRIDHFLGHQTVRHLLSLRLANRAVEPIWNATHVERVEIIWDETLALEGRAGYYDGAGALRDMVQNHLLQLLALVAMEPPATLDARDLRDAKVSALRAVRRPSPEAAGDLSRRARYSAGEVEGEPVPAYVDEDGVEPGAGTETFAEVTFFVDTWRWHGVPFVLRTGKALEAGRREVVLHLRPVPQHPFGAEDVQPNVLRFSMEPDRLSLEVEAAAPDADGGIERVALDHEFSPPDLSAYAHLLLDVLEGDPRLSIRSDEAEEAWRVVAPVLAAWEADLAPLEEYPAGSTGPKPR